MTFLLRAALVIGALSYLALARGGAGGPASLAGPAPSPHSATEAVSTGGGAADSPIAAGLAAARSLLPAAWSALPPAARDQLGRATLAELTRRVAELPPEEPEEQPGAAPAATAAAMTPSRDTLAAADRRAPWRGVEAR